ncbi:MAG: phosphatase PAP2 family protein [bacterium]|nr:phosphatase PAP2 family protein [bacterium]
MKWIIKHLYPEEIIVLLTFIFIGVVFLVLPYEFRWFDNGLTVFWIHRLFAPAISFFIIIFFIAVFKDIKYKKNQTITHLLAITLLDATRIYIIFYIALMIHFNIKIHIGLFRDALYDPALHVVDLWLMQYFGFLSDIMVNIHEVMDLSPLYFLIYELMFLLTFIALYIRNKKQFRLLFCATIITTLLGTLGYYLFPAIGPFLYDQPHALYMQESIADMWANYLAFIASGGMDYKFGLLIKGIAAMPSLHTANAIVFTFFAWKYARYLLIFYIPFTIFILIEALFTKFHYFLDLVLGAEIAAIAIITTYILYHLRGRYFAANNISNETTSESL